MCKYVRLDFKRLDVKIPFMMDESQQMLASFARSRQLMIGRGYHQYDQFIPNQGMSGDLPEGDDTKKEGASFDPAEESTSEGSEPLDEYNALCLKQDVEFGLKYQPKWTIEFDVTKLAILLAIPRKDRTPSDDPYKFLRAIHAYEIRTPQIVTLETDMEDGNYADLANVLKITQGVSFEYSKAEDLNFLPNLLNGLVTVALSCIPVVGPLIACAEQLAYDAILNPEKFASDNVADLSKDLLSAIVDSARDAKGHLNAGKVSKGITRNNKKVQFKVTETAKETYFKNSS